MPLEYRVVVSCLYECQVKCQLKMDSGFSKHFLNNMLVKQGYPLSPKLFGLCIDKLEVVNKVEREEGLNAPKLMQNVILLLLYMQLMWYTSHIMLIVCNIYLEY